MRRKIIIVLLLLSTGFHSCSRYKTDYKEPDLKEGVSIFPKEIDGYLRQVYLLKNFKDKNLRGVKAVYGDNSEIVITVINAYQRQGSNSDQEHLQQKLYLYFKNHYEPKYDVFKQSSLKKKSDGNWIFEAQNQFVHAIIWQNGNWLFAIESQPSSFDAAVDSFKFISSQNTWVLIKQKLHLD